MEKRIFYIVFFGLCLFVRYSENCSCGQPRHPQNEFCRSKFVMIGKVLSVTLIPGQLPDPDNNFAKWRYRIRVYSSIKGYHQAAGSVRSLYTPGNGGVCRLSLNVGTVYALGGRRVSGKRQIELCDFNMEVSRMSFEQLIYLMTKFGPYSYRNNCSCKVTNTNTADSCKIPNANLANCYVRTGVCRRQGGSCKWFNEDCS